MKIAGRNVTRAALRRRASRYRARVVTVVRRSVARLRPNRPGAAVDFHAWTERRRGRRIAQFPDIWLTRPDLRPEQPCTVGVLMHAFYPELVAPLVAQLATIPVEVDLIVTNASGRPLRVDTSAAPNLRHSVVLDVDNHGRDIWPMVQVVNAGLLEPYELVLKVHTKRSPWRQAHQQLAGTGDQWRDSFIETLLGDRDNVTAILAAFAEDPDLGVVTAPNCLLGPEFWGADAPIAAQLLRRLELALEPDKLRFPAGSFYWVRGFVLQGLRSLAMTVEDFEPERGAVDGTTAHGVERMIGMLSTEAGLGMLERPDLPQPHEVQAFQRFARGAERSPRARIVPFYLPQFHPTPENDRWWGPGFTEWTNVTSAGAVYEGHVQPKLPADLGFYDLRLDEVRLAQARLARASGIEGFMYYYYWFAGERLLHEPLQRLQDSDLESPFCVMWANENWTRRWDGRTSDILMGQDYQAVPATEFIDDILKLLLDHRYMRVDGRPIIAVYRVAQIPRFSSVVERWRARAREAGIGELYVLSVDVAREFDGLAGGIRESGLDGTLGFAPHNLRWEWIESADLHLDKRFKGNLMSYQAMVADAGRRLNSLDVDAYPGVMVGFDNTARRQWAPDIWYGSNPYTFRRWLAAATSAVADRDPAHRLVFVNAWTEWAEAAVLEPTQRFGRTFLLAVRDVAFG